MANQVEGQVPAVGAVAAEQPRPNPMRKFLHWGAILLAAMVGGWLGLVAGFPPESWKLLAIFFATILGLILQPIPGPAIVLLGVIGVALTGVMPIGKALSGYSDPIVWLVLSACMLSRGMIKTGLGRRISLYLIRTLGKRSLGLGYAFALTDAVLGSVIPSNGARAGGIIFPVVKSLCEAYDSKPGPSARKLGAYLMLLIYQCDVVVCALFLTGQASNLLIAAFAKQNTGIELTYGTWLLCSIVPGGLSLILVPFVLYKLFPPEIKVTEEAPAFARKELEKIGPTSTREKQMLGVFALVALLWMTFPLHHINYTVVALIGVATLILGGILDWDDILGEKGAWNIYIWYGGLVMLAGALGDQKITHRFAEEAAALISGRHWIMTLVVLLLVYFYAHYGFASVTAHATAMFIPFLSIILAEGAPKWIAVLLLSYFSNLCAAVTHYGTTPGPIYFGAGYVTQRQWWTYGFILSVMHIVVWSGVGLAWWKVLGLW